VIDDGVRRDYFKWRNAGMTQVAAAGKAGISWRTGARWEKARRADRSRVLSSMYGQQTMPGPKSPAQLDKEAGGKDPMVAEMAADAIRGLADFEFFRRAFLGHVSMPWHLDLAERLLETRGRFPEKSYLLANEPPGTGKTTLCSHDYPIWETTKDRARRSAIVSASMPLAANLTGRIKRSLERAVAPKAKGDLLRAGLAVDAKWPLCVAYGRFRPDGQDVWRRERMVVAQVGDMLVADREATFTAFGRDTLMVGDRFDYMSLDDVQDPGSFRTNTQAELDYEWIDAEVEPRLEPGGTLVLPMQRLDANDVSAHCIAKVVAPGEGEDGPDDGLPRQYVRVVYPAHADRSCRGLHRLSDPPYDPRDEENSGCLLDPVRASWRDISGVKRNDPDRYETQYQQKDGSPASVLVPKIWLDGGVETENGLLVAHPGCYDQHRGLNQYPALEGPTVSVVTVDPSPTLYWSCEHWVANQPTSLRFLIDIDRRKMGGPDLLDYNPHAPLAGAGGLPAELSRYSGLLHEWWLRSLAGPHPVRFVVVERNAAQRFLIQQSMLQRWMALAGVLVIAHDTHMNKSDPKLGVTSIKHHYRHGRVRLPHADEMARFQVRYLTRELTRYPRSNTTDAVMAHWFLEWNLDRLFGEVEGVAEITRWVPSYSRRTA
jgi:hypothetical protein